MEGIRQFLHLLVFLQFCQGLMGAVSIYTKPESAVVNPGEEVSFICRVLRDGEVSHDQLGACMFFIGGKSYLFLNQDLATGNIMYTGAGLNQGECGVKIRRVEENLNGNITCSLTPKNSIEGIEGRMTLIVAIPPQKPKLEVTVASDGKRTYKERDVLSANCIVRGGRPVANISWYLGSELITEGLTMPLENCPLEKKELCTIQQNLTRTLQASDDKKVLKCVASHHSFKGNDLFDQHTIFVNYPPKPANRPLEFFALVEGAIGRVPITIDANPRPDITWSIDDEQILEGARNGRYTVEPTVQKVPGEYEYETALLIDTLTKEDTDKKFIVTARNEAGERQYFLSISTSPEPKVLEMGAGLMIIIILAILVILLVLGGVLFARAKGKLCFAAGGEKRVAPPSEGTENPASNHHSSVEYINDVKKEKPKEDTPV